MAVLNATVKSFANNGVITIAADTVSNIQYERVEFTDARRALIAHNDAGTSQIPLEGLVAPGMFNFSVKAGSLVTNSLYVNLSARKGTLDGLVNTFAVVAKIPAHGSATVGESISIADAYLVAPIKWTAGGENQLDTLEVQLMFKTPATIAAYT